MMISPWGKVTQQAGIDEEVLIQDIDLDVKAPSYSWNIEKKISNQITLVLFMLQLEWLPYKDYNLLDIILINQ